MAKGKGTTTELLDNYQHLIYMNTPRGGELVPKVPQEELGDRQRVLERASLDRALKENPAKLLSFISPTIPTHVLENGTAAVITRDITHGYEIESVHFTNGALYRAPIKGDSEAAYHSLKDCQDAASLLLNPFGVLEAFSMADGVSGSFNGKAAAVELTKKAAVRLDALKDKPLATTYLGARKRYAELMIALEADLRSADIEGARREWLAEIQKLTMNPRVRKELLKKLGYDTKDGGLIENEETRSKSQLGSSTLLLGKVSRRLLSLASAADGGHFVLKQDNSSCAVASEKIAHDPPQLRLAGNKLEYADVVYEEIPLNDGDKVCVYTDGFLRNARLELISKNTGKPLNLLLAEEVAHSTLPLEQTVKNLLREVLGQDDVTVLAFTYRDSDIDNIMDKLRNEIR